MCELSLQSSDLSHEDRTAFVHLGRASTNTNGHINGTGPLDGMISEYPPGSGRHVMHRMYPHS